MHAGDSCGCGGRCTNNKLSVSDVSTSKKLKRTSRRKRSSTHKKLYSMTMSSAFSSSAARIRRSVTKTKAEETKSTTTTAENYSSDVGSNSSLISTMSSHDSWCVNSSSDSVLLEEKMKKLQSLIPGGEDTIMRPEKLLLKTADYILLLKSQLHLLQSVSRVYGLFSHDDDGNGNGNGSAIN